MNTKWQSIIIVSKISRHHLTSELVGYFPSRRLALACRHRTILVSDVRLELHSSNPTLFQSDTLLIRHSSNPTLYQSNTLPIFQSYNLKKCDQQPTTNNVDTRDPIGSKKGPNCLELKPKPPWMPSQHNTWYTWDFSGVVTACQVQKLIVSMQWLIECTQ